MAKKACRTQFSPATYPIPADLHNALLGMGWEDASYGNDVCPHFDSADGRWTLWVDALRPEDREMWRDVRPVRRFTLWDNTDEDGDETKTDDESVILARIASLE